jgi:prevent-host-death family protein
MAVLIETAWTKRAIMPIMAHLTPWDSSMKTMSAREAKNAFGLMIDTARAEPVLIEKHGRGVVMVISVEEYERLHASAYTATSRSEDIAAARSASGRGTERA